MLVKMQMLHPFCFAYLTAIVLQIIHKLAMSPSVFLLAVPAGLTRPFGCIKLSIMKLSKKGIAGEKKKANLAVAYPCTRGRREQKQAGWQANKFQRTEGTEVCSNRIKNGGLSSERYLWWSSWTISPFLPFLCIAVTGSIRTAPELPKWKRSWANTSTEMVIAAKFCSRARPRLQLSHWCYHRYRYYNYQYRKTLKYFYQ